MIITIRREFEMSGEDEHLTAAEMIEKIKKINQQPSKTRMLMSAGKRGRKEEYHPMINTAGLQIRALAPVIADYAKL